MTSFIPLFRPLPAKPAGVEEGARCHPVLATELLHLPAKPAGVAPQLRCPLPLSPRHLVTASAGWPRYVLGAAGDDDFALALVAVEQFVYQEGGALLGGNELQTALRQMFRQIGHHAHAR